MMLWWWWWGFCNDIDNDDDDDDDDDVMMMMIIIYMLFNSIWSGFELAVAILASFPYFRTNRFLFHQSLALKLSIKDLRREHEAQLSKRPKGKTTESR